MMTVTNPKCPSCGSILKPVRYPGGSLNEDQWDSVRAGDWYCVNHECDGPKRSGGNRYSYYFTHELTYTKPRPTQTPAQRIVAQSEFYADHWQDKPESYWLAKMVEEVGELASSLVGEHEHAPEIELRQIGSIAINWLRKRERESPLTCEPRRER